jgi:hypothetical protein
MNSVSSAVTPDGGHDRRGSVPLHLLHFLDALVSVVVRFVSVDQGYRNKSDQKSADYS